MFVNVILMIFNTSGVNKKPQTLDLSDHELTFADEFDGDSLDTSKWWQHDGGGVRKDGRKKRRRVYNQRRRLSLDRKHVRYGDTESDCRDLQTITRLKTRTAGKPHGTHDFYKVVLTGFLLQNAL